MNKYTMAGARSHLPGPRGVHARVSKRIPDRLIWPNGPLPDARGSEWSFGASHIYVVHPSAGFYFSETDRSASSPRMGSE